MKVESLDPDQEAAVGVVLLAARDLLENDLVHPNRDLNPLKPQHPLTVQLLHLLKPLLNEKLITAPFQNHIVRPLILRLKKEKVIMREILKRKKLQRNLPPEKENGTEIETEKEIEREKEKEREKETETETENETENVKETEEIGKEMTGTAMMIEVEMMSVLKVLLLKNTDPPADLEAQAVVILDLYTFSLSINFSDY
jgi:hypothetical protein